MVSLSLEAELLQEARLEVGLLAREVGDLLLLEGCLELGYLCGNQPVRRVHPASRRWRGGRRDDSARTRRKILIHTVGTVIFSMASFVSGFFLDAEEGLAGAGAGAGSATGEGAASGAGAGSKTGSSATGAGAGTGSGSLGGSASAAALASASCLRGLRSTVGASPVGSLHWWSLRLGRCGLIGFLLGLRFSERLCKHKTVSRVNMMTCQQHGAGLSSGPPPLASCAPRPRPVVEINPCSGRCTTI